MRIILIRIHGGWGSLFCFRECVYTLDNSNKFLNFYFSQLKLLLNFRDGLVTHIIRSPILTFMASKAQIISLAEAGVAPEVIASRAGVSASYVSQVLSEDSIKTKVLEANLSLLDERTQRDAKYDSIEDTLLDKLKGTLSSIYKPQDILRSLIAINRAERRGATSQQLAEMANAKETTTVNLELPERIRTKIIKSHTREIISVNNRALITKDSRVLLQEVTMENEIGPLDVDLDTEENNNEHLAIEHRSENFEPLEAFRAKNIFEHSS